MMTSKDQLIRKTAMTVDTMLEVSKQVVRKLHPDLQENTSMNDLMQGAITSELSGGINKLYEESTRGVEA